MSIIKKKNSQSLKMAASANRRKQDDKNLEILRELISINGNKYCLDCNQRGPTYVNTTIGSFVCSKCSGMLRGLTPPHRVKSISMATFTPEEIEFIRARGNDYCRRVWLGLYEGESVNFSDEQSVKDFMSDKYEKKRYYLEGAPNHIVNGNVKTKSKSKTGSSSVNNAPLISISPQSSKPSLINNNTLNCSKVTNSLLAMNDGSHKVARPINNFQPISNHINQMNAVNSHTPTSAPVPDFHADFSTADIYNSSQYNTVNNNVPHASMTTNTPGSNFNAFNNHSSANDRYAALADLDQVFRQQNMKTKEELTTVNNKNPFQSLPANDPFVTKNPFNGAWSPAAPVNPFAVPTNNAGFLNSKNPFL